MDTPEWQWNEMQQVGTDYTDTAEVEQYEKRMGEFRDLAAEDAGILESMKLSPNSRIMEVGTGTGHFALAAARAGHDVLAVDISQVMLDYATAKAKAEGLDNVNFVHAGFLSIPCDGDHSEGYDAVMSCVALHHLPDVWKFVAANRIYKVLKPGGLFLLRDVVFDWQGDAHAESLEGFVNSFPEGTRKGAIGHASREFSTFDWIMSGILERAGFSVESNVAQTSSFRVYHCLKK